MTDEEIATVAKIMLTADSFCSNCQSGLFDQLRTAFPGHVATIERIWSKRDEIEAAYLEMGEDQWEGGPVPDMTRIVA